jgi:dolichol kinase
MNDLLLALFWSLVLAFALLACVLLRRIIAATYVRDLLHVGAGVWVFGWPWWEGVLAPVAIVLFAFALTALLPLLRAARPLIDAISGGGESWSGVVGYTASFALFTIAGLLGDPLPAAIALLSLSLGDGLGGLAGRRIGRVRFRMPFAKQKTLEGSLVVLAGAFFAAHLAAFALSESISLGAAALIALAASIAEAISPRSTDNFFVPLAAWAVAAPLVR